MARGDDKNNRKFETYRYIKWKMKAKPNIGLLKDNNSKVPVTYDHKGLAMILKNVFDSVFYNRIPK
jgi:hypothetical protein